MVFRFDPQELSQEGAMPDLIVIYLCQEPFAASFEGQK
jgi:hypothetical protein